MGNNNVKGADEVPISDQHPWGVNGNIKMPIPLDFANEMRKDGTPLNKEYKAFLLYKTYEFIPFFIVGYPLFNEKLPKFLTDTIKKIRTDSTENIFLENSAKIGKINSDTLLRIWNANNYDMLDNMKYYYYHDIQMLFQFPNLLKNEYHKHRYIFFEKPSRGDETTYTIDPIEFSLIVNKRLDTDDKLFTYFERNSQKLKPTNYSSWDEYKAERIKTSSFNKTRQPSDILYFDENKIINNDDTEWVRKDLYETDETFKKIALRNEGITILPLRTFSMHTGFHAITLIFYHKQKYIYITDSYGADIVTDDIRHFITKQYGFDGYKFLTIMPIKNGPGFQTIAVDVFCQTWTIFITLLVLLNSINIDTVGHTPEDINNLVFNEIIKYAKPLVGYDEIKENNLSSEEKMLPGVKLALILIEFMFYVYKSMNMDFSVWMTYTTNKLKEKEKNEYDDYVEAANDILQTNTSEYSEEDVLEKVKELTKGNLSIELDKLRHARYSESTKTYVSKISSDVKPIFTSDSKSYDLVKAIIKGKAYY
jgi:hypothetical protein